MLGDNQSDQGPAVPQPASQEGPVIAGDCRAARIGDVADFAQCLMEDRADCPQRFVAHRFYYCVHPQREKIIARTQAVRLPPPT
jgi:hypothetical protein